MLLTAITVLSLLAGGQDGLRAQPGPEPSRWAGVQPTNAPPLSAESDCTDPANRAAGESEGGCIMRFRRMGPTAPSRTRSPLAIEAARIRPGQPLPPRALSDPDWWVANQCGEPADGACTEHAMDRLMLEHELIRVGQREADGDTVAPAVSQPRAPAQPRCRNVFQRAETGVGGSFSRVCGDGEPESARALDNMRMRDAADQRAAERDCIRRPEPTDQGVRWTLVCGARENRDRARDALDALLD